MTDSPGSSHSSNWRGWLRPATLGFAVGLALLLQMATTLNAGEALARTAQQQREGDRLASSSEEGSLATSFWVLDAVEVRSYSCDRVLEIQPGAGGMTALSTNCSEANERGTASAQATMQFEYPLELVPGQESTFSLSADASMSWDFQEEEATSEAVLQVIMDDFNGPKDCGGIQSPNHIGGSSGAASLHVEEIDCVFDAKDLYPADEIDFNLRVWPWVEEENCSSICGYWLAFGMVKLTYRRFDQLDDVRRIEGRAYSPGSDYPLIGVPVTLLRSGSVLRRAVTLPPDGRFVFPGVPVTDTLVMSATLEHVGTVANQPSTFQVLYGQAFGVPLWPLAYVATKPFDTASSSTGLLTKDIIFADVPDTVTHPDFDRAHLDDMGVIYHHIHQAWQLTDQLSQPLDFQLPLDIVAYSPVSSVFWLGPSTDGANALADPHINIEADRGSSEITDKSRPDNREWHEFGHHVMADTFANLMPKSPGDKNHGGYPNPSSTDSWVEGFAEFYSMMVTREIVAQPEKRPELYQSSGFQINMETNFQAWLTLLIGDVAIPLEEFAVAGLLLDLVDPVDADDASVGGDTTYADCVEMSLEQLWYLLSRNWEGAVDKSPAAPAGYGYVFDVKHLYDVLKRENIGFQHSRGRDFDDLDELFIAHGFYGDWDLSGSYDSGEEIGRAAEPDRYERRSGPPVEGSFIAYEAVDELSGAPLDVLDFSVEVRFAQPFEHYGYSFQHSAAQGSGRLYYMGSDPQYDTQTIITAWGPGIVSTEPLTITNDVYWDQMALGPADFFLEHTFEMEDSERVFMPLLVGSAQSQLAAAAGSPVIPRSVAPARQGRACYPDAPTPTPTATPTVTSPPIVDSIEPASAPNDQTVQVTIYGYFFKPGATPYVGSTELLNVIYLGPEVAPPHRWRIRADVPAGLVPGTYDVTVANPGGASGVLPDAFTVTGGPAATATATPTATPSPTATPTPTPTCTPTAVGSAGIFGQVTKEGTPAADLELELRHWDGNNWSALTTTTTDSEGRYEFDSLPDLAQDQFYVVAYSNTTTNPNPGPGNLWSWWGDRIDSYTAGQSLAGGDFDVYDIALDTPRDGRSVSLPAEFCWTQRPIPTDNYELVFYHAGTDSVASTSYLGYVPCVTLTGLPPDWPSGDTYTWWVRAYQGDDPDNTPYNFGDSYDDREVTISYATSAMEPGNHTLLPVSVEQHRQIGSR